jgi:phosphatidylserine/phosphatidylglycerophosphate/cardiolipin synthase-like enzyme
VAGCGKSLSFSGGTTVNSGSGSHLSLQVYFSPKGGCEDAIMEEIPDARQTIRVQAYGFTNKDIAAALRDAKRRGVDVEVVLDKSNETAQYSAATFTSNAGIATYIDAKHAIAHNKIMVVDGATVITGSFNFTNAAETRNAENVLIIKNAPDLVRQYEQNYEEHKAHSHIYKRSSRSSSRTNSSSRNAASPLDLLFPPPRRHSRGG